MKRLADGTPFDAEWQQRCSVCRSWLGETTLAHGSFLAPFCRGQKLPRTGRKRLNVAVASRLTRPDKDGHQRWNEGYLIAASPAQVAEARAYV